MSGKNQYPVTFNWSSTSPITGFLPIQAALANGSTPSGTVGGVMSSTNTIYSQIICTQNMDNGGLEVTWTGTPTGTFSVVVSNSGLTFYALTFNPTLAQPAGSGGGYAVDLNQLPFRYLMLQYVNASGSGLLTVYGQFKDLN